MLVIYLIRHGNKKKIPFDPPLTETGIKQAEVTGDFLIHEDFKAIFASPKLRTMQTAEIIAGKLNLSVTTDKRLVERLEWENHVSFEKFVQEWAKTDQDRSYAPLKGNSSIKKGLLMRELIGEIYSKYTSGNIIIVTHGGAIGDLLRNLFGDASIVHDIDTTTHTKHIHISECSITKIGIENGKSKIIQINGTSHLPELLISRD